MTMKVVRGNYVILSLICLVLGFMLSFSYEYTKSRVEKRTITDKQWNKEYEYRQLLIQSQKENQKLKAELMSKQEKVRKMEASLADKKKAYSDLATEAEQLRMYIGKVKVRGAGVEVTLSDASYIPSEQSATNYIVHEQHVLKVVHELLISGAEAIAINGQRISHRSYIVCTGPVIEVDGTQHSAPFTISAIGDSNVLASALTIAGGVKDQLTGDHVVVDIQQKDDITLDPIFHTNRE
jgi:uncharacterized protein YlxW (UPF0749 family)